MGAYIMDFFSNANFIDSEINDSIGNAQIIGTENAFTGGSVTGIIDTIKDMDYYKLNITSPMMIHINFDAPENHSMVWINTDSSPERLYYSNGNCILSTGVHYFAVYDTKGYSYTSILEARRVSRAFYLKMGSADGQTVLGTRVQRNRN